MSQKGYDPKIMSDNLRILNNLVQEVKKENKTLKAALKASTEMIKECEWSGKELEISNGQIIKVSRWDECCYVCENLETEGHKKDCRLANRIAENERLIKEGGGYD